MGTVRLRLSRDERREETRRQLLDAALRVFTRRGFEAASVEEIAEAAGFTRGAFYSNFRDKGDAIVAVLADKFEAKVADLTAIANASPDPRERSAMLRADFLAACGQDDLPMLYAELQLAAARHPELRRRLRSLFDEHSRRIADAVAPGVPYAVVRPVFVGLTAAMEGITLQRAGGHASEDDARRALGIVYDALFATLGLEG